MQSRQARTHAVYVEQTCHRIPAVRDVVAGGEGGAKVHHHTGQVIHALLVVMVTTGSNIWLHVKLKWEFDVLHNFGV